MSLGPVVKDPNASQAFSVDWTDYLNGATIGTSSWHSTPAGLTHGTLTTSGTISGGTSTSITVSGGTVGTVYQLVNQIVATDGTIDERTITVRCEEL